MFANFDFEMLGVWVQNSGDTTKRDAFYKKELAKTQNLHDEIINVAKTVEIENATHAAFYRRLHVSKGRSITTDKVS